MKTLTFPVERLSELFKYDPLTGKLIRASNRPNQAKAGDEAGWLDNHGYRVAGIMNRTYQVHRIIWAMTYGEWPVNEIDHINGDRSDNRIENLRSVTRRENTLNRTYHRAGKLHGCTKDGNRWRVRICIGNKCKYVGMFLTEQEAHNAYVKELEALL